MEQKLHTYALLLMKHLPLKKRKYLPLLTLAYLMNLSHAGNPAKSGRYGRILRLRGDHYLWVYIPFDVTIGILRKFVPEGPNRVAGDFNPRKMGTIRVFSPGGTTATSNSFRCRPSGTNTNCGYFGP